MRTGAKMMLMTSGRGGGRMEGGMEMGYARMEDMEARRRYRRDSRGRFRAEMEGYGGMEAGGGYGRSEMESRGGYGRSEMESEEDMRREKERMREGMRGGGHPFPVYEEGGYGMNPIGFNPNREIETEYRMNATHHRMNEMESRGGPRMSGRASSTMTMPMSKEMAEEWIYSMKNADGSRGPHWQMEEAKKLMERKKLNCNPYEFAAVLNALYSDYCKVFEKHGVMSEELYADLACAWLQDEDAMPNKAMLYYDCIVKK